MSIFKTVNRVQNRKLAAPIEFVTSLTAGDATKLVVQLCESLNARFDAEADSLSPAKRHWNGMGGEREQHHYLVAREERELLIGMGRDPRRMRATAHKGTTLRDEWLATVRYPNRPEVNGTVVQVALEQWVMSQGSGTMSKRARYEDLLEALRTALPTAPT